MRGFLAVRVLGLARLFPALIPSRWQPCSAAVDSSSAARVLVFGSVFVYFLAFIPCSVQVTGPGVCFCFARVFLFLRRLYWLINKVWLLKKKSLTFIVVLIVYVIALLS